MDGHAWFTGPWAAESYPAQFEADCHRQLRGPYTGLGNLLRALVPGVYAKWPELTREHGTEILSAAPELTELIGEAPETLTSISVETERTRLYPLVRTRRLAHGIVEFLGRYQALSGISPLTLYWTNVNQADNTDQEFLAILLRRCAPTSVRVLISLRDDGVSPTDELMSALHRYASWAGSYSRPSRADSRDGSELARAYVESDGTSEDPAEAAAYRNTDPGLRAALHDDRASVLQSSGEWSLRLGAIPYHLERGTDPSAASIVLLDASNYCVAMGYYHALLDYGRRGQQVTDPDAEPLRYWRLATKATTALSFLGETEESERLYIGLRAQFTQPMLHLFTGYALAMLYTRFHPAGRKDDHIAKAYINNAIAIASQFEDPAERAFHTVFHQNGLAFVEMHMGNLSTALRLVNEGLARLDRELPEGRHRLHRSVLVHNRAKVHAALGRLEDALTDFNIVVDVDPNYSDYYFDRADIRQKLGDDEGALADYDTAIKVTPPFWELHYNRADLRARLGDLDGAISDLRRVVELEPGELDARVNLVSLLLETGDLVVAADQIAEGLSEDGDARLLCLRGQLALATGDTVKARADFDSVLARDGEFVAALAGRAEAAYSAGDFEAAVDDLTRAIGAVPDQPELLFNRAQAHQAAQHWTAAIEDYARALTLPGTDQAELLHHRAECHLAAGDINAYQADVATASAMQSHEVVPMS